MATVTYQPADPEIDSQAIKDSFKSPGSDEDSLIQILAYRTNEQRQRICNTYKNMFGEDLAEVIKSELSGSYAKTLKLMLMPSQEYYAAVLHKALRSRGTKADWLLEVLCTVTNTQIRQIKDVYEEKYGKSLEDAINDDAPEDFKRLLLMICKAARNEGVVSLDKVRTDAEALFEAGEAQWDAEEAAFNTLFAFESYEHLRFVFQEYEDITGRSLFEAIELETTGDLKKALLTLVSCVENTAAFFARKLYKLIRDSEQNEDSIMRIIVSRSEIDMVFIKTEYEKKYKRSLEAAIQDITTGEFQHLLVALISN